MLLQIGVDRSITAALLPSLLLSISSSISTISSKELDLSHIRSSSGHVNTLLSVALFASLLLQQLPLQLLRVGVCMQRSPH